MQDDPGYLTERERSPGRGDLAVWQRVTHAAIAAERDGQRARARAGYQRALDIAGDLIDDFDLVEDDRVDDRMAALVVSYLNLADWLVSDGDIDGAAQQLCAAHAESWRLLLDETRASVMRAAALRHSRATHAALIRHVASYGPHPRITWTLRLVQTASGPSGSLPH